MCAIESKRVLSKSGKSKCHKHVKTVHIATNLGYVKTASVLSGSSSQQLFSSQSSSLHTHTLSGAGITAKRCD